MFLVAAFLIMMFVSVTLFRRDAWPFTRYPMFSRYRDARHMCVICFALETPEGNVTWWRPHFYRYPDILNKRMARENNAHNLWYVSEVLRLVRLEEGDARRYCAVHIIERRWVDCAILDRTLARVAVNRDSHAV